LVIGSLRSRLGALLPDYCSLWYNDTCENLKIGLNLSNEKNFMIENEKISRGFTREKDSPQHTNTQKTRKIDENKKRLCLSVCSYDVGPFLKRI
jgi:hypothetical protein